MKLINPKKWCAVRATFRPFKGLPQALGTQKDKWTEAVLHKAVATDVHSSESRVEMSSRLTPPPFIPFPLCVVLGMWNWVRSLKGPDGALSIPPPLPLVPCWTRLREGSRPLPWRTTVQPSESIRDPMLWIFKFLFCVCLDVAFVIFI